MKKLLALILTMNVLIIAVVYYHKHQDVPIPPDSPPVIERPVTPWKPPKTFNYDEAVQAIIEADLKKDLFYLASPELEGRMSGKKGNKLAADWVEAQYKSFGLKTMRQKFPIRRENPGPKNETGDDFTENVIAWREGSVDEIVVIGAHMDHIGYGPAMSQAPRRREIHPGADDNASGTVALLQIARAFSRLEPPKRTTVFMSFSGEEMGLLGSKYYCDHPLFPLNSPSISKHVAMLNFDMIGYLKSGGVQAVGSASPDIDGIIKGLGSKYSFSRAITSRGSGGSDHAPFYNKRIPVAFLHTGMHSYYHTPDDTPERINYKGLEQVARYAFELSWGLSNNNVAPRFDHASFEPMKMTHDHGDIPFERK